MYNKGHCLLLVWLVCKRKSKIYVRNYVKLAEPTKNAAIMLADRWPLCMTITCKWRISRWQDVNTRQRLSFSFRDLRYSPSEFNARKIRQYSTNWNKPDKDWSGANSLFKWRFRNHRRRCCFSLGELESSKIFAEHALQVARVGVELRGNSRALGTAGSIMTIGLSINACWHS